VALSKSQKKKKRSAAPTVARLSSLGCSVLQGILTFAYAECQPYADSLAAQPAEDLLTLVRDRGGCRCVEAFLGGGAGAKAKSRVLASLRGSYLELARGSAAGARTVEACFEAGSLEDKEAIAAELAPREGQLSKLRWGAALLKKTDLAGLGRSREQWQRNAKKAKETLAEFGELFGGDAAPGDAAGAAPAPGRADGEGEREAVRRAMRVGGAAVDEVMALLGFAAGGRTGGSARRAGTRAPRAPTPAPTRASTPACRTSSRAPSGARATGGRARGGRRAGSARGRRARRSSRSPRTTGGTGSGARRRGRRRGGRSGAEAGRSG